MAQDCVKQNPRLEASHRIGSRNGTEEQNRTDVAVWLKSAPPNTARVTFILGQSRSPDSLESVRLWVLPLNHRVLQNPDTGNLYLHYIAGIYGTRGTVHTHDD